MALGPTGLLCELLSCSESTEIRTDRPRFGWVVRDSRPDAVQTAYRVQVSSASTLSADGDADVWDSGRVPSSQSINVEYGGPALARNTAYCWRVRTWNRDGGAGPWSEVQRFRTGTLDGPRTVSRHGLAKQDVAAVEVVETGPGHLFFDFGKAAFGTLRFRVEGAAEDGGVDVVLGEKLAAPGCIDREPPGSIRCRRVRVPLTPGTADYTVAIPSDARNTGPAAVPMPADVGEVLPFRYCEIEGAPASLDAADVRMVAVHYPFDERASSFACSDPDLCAIWDLCKYSIKATSFCGLYVDGDRERIPYEADAYINQLCHYGVDREFAMARATHEYLLFRPTWPTEWILHSVLVAWADYEYTGAPDLLARYYDELVAKTLLALARDDGLISTQTGLVTEDVLRSVHLDCPIKDIVDWPPSSFSREEPGECDGHEMMAVNTVVNAFHYRALVLMGKIAEAVGREEDAVFFRDCAQRVHGSFNARLFDPARSVYVDGEGSEHASLHSNMLPLAFGLVPEARRSAVVAFVKSRGMACSVYGAQYLFEALYEAGEADHALDLMTADHDRGWLNMMRVGSTVTLEAWDYRYKNNLDWNHAWGAAPANIIPRYLVGVRPLEPGFGRILIQPKPGRLASVAARVPTIRGPVEVRVERGGDGSFRLGLEIPANTSARVLLPRLGDNGGEVLLDGRALQGQVAGDSVAVDPVGSGPHTLERRRGTL